MTDIIKTPAVAADISDDKGTLSLTFAHGKTLVLHVSQLSADVGAYALMHGLKQKLVDAAALSRNPDTGRSATIDDKYNAVREVYDRLLAGHWNKPRDGASAPKGGLLFAALVRMQPGKNPDDIRAWLETKTDAEKAALRKNPKVAAIIADIQAERAKSGDVDTDALLDELNG